MFEGFHEQQGRVTGYINCLVVCVCLLYVCHMHTQLHVYTCMGYCVVLYWVRNQNLTHIALTLVDISIYGKRICVKIINQYTHITCCNYTVHCTLSTQLFDSMSSSKYNITHSSHAHTHAALTVLCNTASITFQTYYALQTYIAYTLCLVLPVVLYYSMD